MFPSLRCAFLKQGAAHAVVQLLNSLRASGFFFEDTSLVSACERMKTASSGDCMLLRDCHAAPKSTFLVLIRWKSRTYSLGVVIADSKAGPDVYTIGMDMPPKFFDNLFIRNLAHGLIWKLLERYQISYRPEHFIACMVRHGVGDNADGESGQEASVKEVRLLRCPATLQAITALIVWTKVVHKTCNAVDSLPLPPMVKDYVLAE